MQNPTVQLKNAFGAGNSAALFRNLYSTMANNNIGALSYNATFQTVSMRQTTSIDALGREITTTEMSMQEYQVYISAKIDDIPFHSTRPFDEQAINISEAGWQKMKDDPAHENFILEAIRASRQMVDEFFNQGSVGNYSVLSFDETQQYGSNFFSKMLGDSLEMARAIFENESQNAFWIGRAARAEESMQQLKIYRQTQVQMQIVNAQLDLLQSMEKSSKDSVLVPPSTGTDALLEMLAQNNKLPTV